MNVTKMQNHDELYFLDLARENASELGEIIKEFLPEEHQAELLTALLYHITKKNHGSAERLFRTFESGLMEGLIDLPSTQKIRTIN